MTGSSHLGVTDNQKRWLVAGIALNKILIPQIRPFVEQEVDKEYNNLKTSHNIHTQSTSGRLQRWPPRKFLKYENVNGNDLQPKLPNGRYDYSLFDCRVLSHVDFARLYVENYMAKFNAFDDRCDASAVLLLLGGVPVFSPSVQAAAGDVRMARNDWAHCVFSKWDPTKFQQSFIEMEHLVRFMALPAADEGKLLGELKDWETKGVQLCMNSPVDSTLLQLVQQNIKSLQDDVNNMSAEFDQEKVKVQQELQNAATILKEMRETIQRLEDKADDFQGDTNQRFESLEGRTGQVENQVHNLQEKFDDLTVKSQESAAWHHPPMAKPVANPEKFVELIRRDYRGAVLCPFPWCEDELQMKLSNIFTRLQIVSRTKERSKLTNDTVNMTDVFKPHAECVNPRVVLIEGNPGMGKTTYCQKLAYDWSVGEISPEVSFPEVEMLLLLKCRGMHMKTANIEEAIDDQLLPRDADKKEKENFFHFIRSNQSRILLVLDGLDELCQDLVQGFLPLIQGKVFSNIYLVLTARHEAGMRIRRYCDTLLEIVGYTCDDADDYIKRYFSNHEDESLAGKMINQLNKDRQLRELTVNPLNTALLCLLYDETRGVFPSKRTKLYDDLVSCALRRYFAKRGVSLDDDDPLERCADQLNQLGRVAFEALLKDQMYFSQDEMKGHSEDFLQLCFLSREPSVSKIRPTPCYAFTHKTFQEYFAAFYLAHQVFTGDKGKERLLDQLSPFDNWQVWEFLFTMTASKSTEMAVIVVSRLCASVFYHKRPQRLNDADVYAKFDLYFKICKQNPHDWTESINRLSNYEIALGDVLTKTLRLIAKCEHGENELKDYQTKMIHVLAHCFPVKTLQLRVDTHYCSVYSEYLKFNRTLTDLLLNGAFNPLLLATTEHVFHSNHNLVHFSLSAMYDPFVSSSLAPHERDKAVSNLNQRRLWMQSFGSKALFTNVLRSGLLTHLNLDSVWISDEGTQVLADILYTNRTLTHLNLRHAMISDFGAKALGNVLQSNCTLTHLSLSGNLFSGTGTAFLARGLQSNPVVMFLDLSKNLGSDSGAVALAQALESNCALKYLDLSWWCGVMDLFQRGPFAFVDSTDQRIGPVGGSALAKALRLNCTLTYLGLMNHNIGVSGAIALGEALQTNCTLTELYLKGNEIGQLGAEALGKALQSNRSLTILDLQGNFIGDSGAAAVAKALQSNGSLLTRLNLSFNKICSSGGIAIAEALQSNSSLTQLHLRHDGIESSGAVAIANALKSNRTLTHLDLRCNGIGDSGATELAQALQYYNNTLIFLDLREDESIASIGTESLKQIDRSNCIVEYGYSPYL